MSDLVIFCFPHSFNHIFNNYKLREKYVFINKDMIKVIVNTNVPYDQYESLLNYIHHVYIKNPDAVDLDLSEFIDELVEKVNADIYRNILNYEQKNMMSHYYTDGHDELITEFVRWVDESSALIKLLSHTYD